MSRVATTLLASCLATGLLALICCSPRPVSCGWLGLGLSQDEMLTKLRAQGAQLPGDKVYDILTRAKDDNWQVDNFSVKELRSLHKFTLEKCTAEELDRRHSIANRPLQDEKANENLRRYATDDFRMFVVFCARNADKVFRRHIIAIGATIRRELSYFRMGVQAKEQAGLQRGKAIGEYLASGAEYLDGGYKQTIATDCKIVNEHLSHIVAIHDHAKKLNQPINLNYSLQEWLLLNDYCKLYNENFANQ